jgi:sulfite reductase beta subunit-like hemoprotein
MTKLTLADTRALRDMTVKAVDAIDDFQDRNWDNGSLTREEYMALDALERDLNRNAGELTTRAVGLSIDNMEDPATHLKQVTERAIDTVATLKTIEKVIEVAAALLDVVAGVVSKDPKAAIKATKTLVDTLDKEE